MCYSRLVNEVKLQKAVGIILIGIFASLLMATTTGLLSINQKIPSSGTIQTIELDAFMDIACTQECTEMDFGTLNPGGISAQTIYIKNTGTTPIFLSLTVNNWNPAEAGLWMSISWDRENYVLNSGESILATLSLSVDESIEVIEYFDFDVTLKGTQLEEL